LAKLSLLVSRESDTYAANLPVFKIKPKIIDVWKSFLC